MVENMTNSNNNSSLLERTVREQLTPQDIKMVRNSLITNVCETYLWHRIGKIMNINFEFSKSTQDLFQYQKKHYNDGKGIGILINPIHINFLETLAIPSAVKEIIGGVTPYSIMNKDRIPDKAVLRWLVAHVGIFGLDTVSSNSSMEAKCMTEAALSRRRSVVYFAEGHRSDTGLMGNFAVAGIQGAIEAAKSVSCFVVPVSSSWPYVHEVMNGKEEKYGLKEIIASLKIEHGDPTIAFGEPIAIKPPNLDELEPIAANKIMKTYRTDLKNQIYNSCADLKRILPEYIHARAITRLNPIPGTKIIERELLNSISCVLKEIEPFQDKVRGIPLGVDSSWILRSSILPTDSNLLKKYEVYENYAAPFWPKA